MCGGGEAIFHASGGFCQSFTSRCKAPEGQTDSNVVVLLETRGRKATAY